MSLIWPSDLQDVFVHVFSGWIEGANKIIRRWRIRFVQPLEVKMNGRFYSCPPLPLRHYRQNQTLLESGQEATDGQWNRENSNIRTNLFTMSGKTLKQFEKDCHHLGDIFNLAGQGPQQPALSRKTCCQRCLPPYTIVVFCEHDLDVLEALQEHLIRLLSHQYYLNKKISEQRQLFFTVLLLTCITSHTYSLNPCTYNVASISEKGAAPLSSAYCTAESSPTWLCWSLHWQLTPPTKNPIKLSSWRLSFPAMCIRATPDTAFPVMFHSEINLSVLFLFPPDC